MTPRLAKTQALLAFLALAGEQPVDRQTLQNLLWGDRMPQQGRDSLKKALTELRRAFADAKDQPVLTDGGPVTLRLADIAVDALASVLPAAEGFYTPKFLDGLEFPNEGYMRWLEGVRAKLSSRQKAQPEQLTSSPTAPRMSAAGVRVTLMPLMCRADDAEAVHLATRIADSLTSMLRQSGLFIVHDLRAGQNGVDQSPDLCLNIAATSFQQDAVLGMRLTSATTSEQIWAMEEVFNLPSLDVNSVNICTSGALDQIFDCVQRRSDIFDERHLAARTVIGAIDHIFRLSNDDLGAAEAALAETSQIYSSSPLYAWYAYLSAFQVEKMGRANAQDIIERADYLSARAIELDRTNPLSIALISHVQSFVVRNMGRAHELLHPVVNQAGRNVMLADAIGMLHYYNGNYKGAKKYAQLTCNLGRFNQFKYAFSTSLAMNHLMLGEYEDAIRSAERALGQHGMGSDILYEPTLRTLASAYSLAGRLDEGRVVLDRLETQSGASALDSLGTSEDAPFPNQDTFTTVRKGIEQLYG